MLVIFETTPNLPSSFDAKANQSLIKGILEIPFIINGHRRRLAQILQAKPQKE
jgi:hypothetical protein